MILIPIACLLFIIYSFKKSLALKMLIQKLVVFALAIILIVPASVRVTNLIENAYGESIKDAISQAESAFPDQEEEEKDTEEDAEEATSNVDNDSNTLSRAWASVVDTVDNASETVKSAAASVGNYLTEVKTIAKEVLIHFLRVLALMIVTSCIIPILVLIFFLWLIKIILNLDINLSAPRF